MSKVTKRVLAKAAAPRNDSLITAKSATPQNIKTKRPTARREATPAPNRTAKTARNAKTKRAASRSSRPKTTSPKTKVNGQAHSFRPTSKLARVVEMLRRPKGATINELTATTGWQEHSVRGALSGAVKKRLKLAIVSERVDGKRRYRIEA